MNNYFVYIFLIDDVPRYVGISADPGRLYDHMRKTHNARLREMIDACRRADGEPQVDIVSRHATEEGAHAAEVALIARYGRLDLNSGTLTNDFRRRGTVRLG